MMLDFGGEKVDGWISLHRKIRKNPIFNDLELLRLWLICLTEATHKERDQLIGKQKVHLMQGEFITGRFDLHEMYNRGLKRDQQKSPKTVWRWLEGLENSEYLTIKSTNKFSIVAVLNWHKYQSSDHDNDQQMTNKRPTDDQQMTTNNNVNNSNNKKPSSPKRVYDELSIPYRTANYLYTNILKFKSDLKQPNLQTWSEDMRKLIEVDKRDPKEIGKVIEWVTTNDFWQVNILSASKLREKWDMVTAKMKQDGFKGSRNTTGSLELITTTEEEREFRERFIENRRKNGVGA